MKEGLQVTKEKTIKVKIAYIAAVALFITGLTACTENGKKSEKTASSTVTAIKNTSTAEVKTVVKSLISSSGMTVKDRFLLPEGYVRTIPSPGSFEEYLQTLPLKADGSIVHFFDGSEKTRIVYDAVLDIDVGDRDLQQCADAVMRLRSEYLYKNKRYNEIAFHFVNGFNAEYSKWRQGYRIRVEGNNAYWVKTNGPSDDYKSFRSYLDMVYSYAGTLSLIKEVKPVDIKDMSIGDIFIDNGHTIIVLDMAENKSTGKKLFMLAQSYMPAQDIQILKNPEDTGLSPWYDLDFGEILHTPEWTFRKGDLKRF